MCGRYTLRTPSRQLALPFGVDELPEYVPRYNIGPGQSCFVVRNNGGGPEIAALKWGLLPHFVADPKRGAKPINARAETVATNGFFKGAFAHRRCIIPADGFYEPEEDDRGQKTGRWWYFRFDDDRLFGFAGLWESWGEGGERRETFTIITTDPMDAVANCGHQRSPVILPPERYDLWLDPQAKTSQLKKLLGPHPSDEVIGYPVDGRAKNPRNEGPDLIEPADGDAA